MKQVFAPWRIEWVEKDKDSGDGCVFCSLPKEEKDSENLILARSSDNYVLMNNYPYNPGHLLIIPYSHIDRYDEIPQEILQDHAWLKQQSLKSLRSSINPDGFNTGMNLGESSGGSIDNHIHTHIVPRWSGDTNFMPVISDTKVIVEALNDTYEKIRKAFLELETAKTQNRDTAVKLEPP